MKLLVGVAAIVMVIAGGNGASLIPPFSLDKVENGLPTGWEPLLFEKIENHTKYKIVNEGGIVAIMAVSESSASGVVFKTETSAKANLSWNWKVDSSVKNADMRVKKGDDAAARIYVMFKYDPDKASGWMRFKYGVVKLIYGEYPPHATLNYVWANRVAVGEIVTSPYTDRVKIIVLESGNAKSKQWVVETVNIHDDYVKSFGEEPPLMLGIGVMTDTDNSGGKATAWYADFKLAPSNK